MDTVLGSSGGREDEKEQAQGSEKMRKCESVNVGKWHIRK